MGEEQSLTLFVNHLKSMFGSDPQNGRRNTYERRKLQAEKVRELVTERFGEDAGVQSFMVLGDLNDYLATDEQGSTAIADLVEWDQVENVVDRLPESERWTHFYRGATHQLDYILPSKSLAERSASEPEIIRARLPRAASAYTGERFIDGMPNPPMDRAGGSLDASPVRVRLSTISRNATWRPPRPGARGRFQALERQELEANHGVTLQRNG